MNTLHYIFILFCLGIIKINAQVNLVPNPSFEDKYSCPDNFSELYKAKHWINFQGSPDLVSGCASYSTGVNAPNCWLGYQNVSSGTSYASMFTYQYSSGNNTNIREFIGTQLTTPLVKNTKYFISMKISPGFSPSFNICTNNMSLLFTNYKMDSSVAQTPNKSHLKCTAVIIDTINWTTIKGAFIADSVYSFLTIGNLYNDSYTSIDTSYAHQKGYTPGGAYCFVDDICVSTDSLFAYNYIYTGMNKNKISNKIIAYPNPCNDYLTIEVSSLSYFNVSLITIIGDEKLLVKNCLSKSKINTSQLENGIYILRIKNETEEFTYKVFINH